MSPSERAGMEKEGRKRIKVEFKGIIGSDGELAGSFFVYDSSTSALITTLAIEDLLKPLSSKELRALIKRALTEIEHKEGPQR